MRFVAGAAFLGPITYQNLLDTILVATDATTVKDLFETVRVDSVEIWAVPAMGSTSTVSVEFNGLVAGSVGDQKIHSDTSMGVQPAHVIARPQAKSLASNFQTSSATNAFLLNVPAGAIIDVMLSFRSTFGSTTTAQNAAVGATAGFLYLRGLDGVAKATSQLLPVLYSSTQI